MKRFNVVIPREDGGVEVYRMKEWLRLHPEHAPSGLDPTSGTSHQWRNALKKAGWTVQETSNEVRLTLPGAARFENTIDAVLGEGPDFEESTQDEPSFALEYRSE